MKLNNRLKFINEPIFIIAFTLFVITLLGFLMYEKPKKVKVKVKQPSEVTILYKKDKELSNWRYGYYEHLYYTD